MNCAAPTDNLAYLLALGFTRTHPTISCGDRAHLWSRQIDGGYQQIGKHLKRVWITQRAILRFITHSALNAQPPVNKSAILRDKHACHNGVVARALESIRIKREQVPVLAALKETA